LPYRFLALTPERASTSRRAKKEKHIYERTGRDTPQVSASPSRRVNEGNASQGPKHDLICYSSNLSTREGVTKFVNQNDDEYRHVFEDAPNRRFVLTNISGDIVGGDDKPGEMQENRRSRRTEKDE
jgi:hypothetical protein